MLADIVQLIGAIGVMASLLFLTWQTRQLIRQTAISNAIGKTAAHYNAIERLHDVNKVIIERPALRPYFYDSKPCPIDDPSRPRVLTLAEMMGDVIDYGLEVTRQFPDPIHGNCWRSAALTAAKQPVMQEAMRSNFAYWPDLTACMRDQPWMSLTTEPQQSSAIGE